MEKQKTHNMIADYYAKQLEGSFMTPYADRIPCGVSDDIENDVMKGGNE